MTCDEAREHMTGAWKEECYPEPAFQRHLDKCPECVAEMVALGGLWDRLGDIPLPEPGVAMHVRWHATLASLMPQRARRPMLQLAGALGCVLIGVAIGAVIGERLPNRNGDEIAKLREMVALSLLQQQSATERLRGVDYSGRMPTMQPEVVLALVGAVSHDPNVNVRIAAIDALSKVATNPDVVESLTRSLPRQDSPVVQAELIDYLVDAHDRRAVAALRELAARQDLNPAVLERTRFALEKLSH